MRKKLDAAIERCAGLPVTSDGRTVSVAWGEDAVVTLTPGPAGTVTDSGAALCGCLLAPRCLHRAAVLSACPVADPDAFPESHTPADPDSLAEADPFPGLGSLAGTGTPAAPDVPAGTGAPAGPDAPVEAGAPALGRVRGSHGARGRRRGPAGRRARPAVTGPGAKQVAAAAGLWAAAVAVLSGGVPGAGAVPQAELLRAAHTARLAACPGPRPRPCASSAACGPLARTRTGTGSPIWSPRFRIFC
ncbi:hypothetical protein ACFQX6_03445 [Streptosporangium lutulentum]